jgi:integrase
LTKQRQSHPLTVAEFKSLRAGLSIAYSRMACGMAYTGMGWTEYMGRWEWLPDRIQIHGTKRAGRDRVVPVIEPMVRYERPYKAFREALSKAATEAGLPNVTPYDFRRTYAGWLEDAGIPRTRRRLYMGHGAKDVTDLYERREIDRYLAEDAERLKTLIGATEAPSLKLEKKA